MNPYEILEIATDASIEDIHVAFATKHEALILEQRELLGLNKHASAVDWMHAREQKAVMLSSTDTNGEPIVDEPWTNNVRNLASVDQAYVDLTAGLNDYDILGVSRDVTVPGLLEACAALLTAGASANSLISNAFTNVFVVIRQDEYHIEEVRQRNLAPGYGMFGPRPTHPSRYEQRENYREQIDRRNNFKDESYHLWDRLTLSIRPRN